MRENAHSWTFLLISLLHPNVPKNCCKFHENTINKNAISTFECEITKIVDLQLDCPFHSQGKWLKNSSNFDRSPCTHFWSNLNDLRDSDHSLI